MSLRDARVLVTGATGFVGGHLVRRLAAEGAQVAALSRSPERHTGIGPGIRFVKGDLTEPESLAAAVRACDIVFHCAVDYGSMAAQRAVNVEGTRHLALAASRAGARRFIQVSSVAVYGYKVRADTAESAPYLDEGDTYGKTKAAGEQALHEVAAGTGLAFSIIRPGLIYGPGAGLWTRTLFRVARMRPTPFIGSGDGSAHPICVDDVVDLMLVLALHPAAPGQAFNCTPDPAPTWRDWIGAYQKLAGTTRWLAIPPRLIESALRFGQLFAGSGGQNAFATYLDMARMMQARYTYCMDKARALLGWQPAIDLETGVGRCAPWLREQGLLD